MGGAVGTSEPWTVLTDRQPIVPQVSTVRIRFITPDVALVDGMSRIEGSATLARTVPLLFVMKKQGCEWRINAVSLVGGERIVIR
jgi:hypothetical protein